MTLQITDLEDAIRDWVVGALGIEAIFAHPNAPRPPSVQYALMHIITATPQGIAEAIGEVGLSDTVDMDYSNLDSIMVSINIYRSDAFKQATKLKDSLGKITVIETLYAEGLGYQRVTAITESTAELNKVWEERARFDVFFYTRSLAEENLELIKKIQLINKIEGNMIWNGGFDEDTYWTKEPGWSIADGVASCDGSQPSKNVKLLQQISISKDYVLYKVTYDITAYTIGTVRSRLPNATPWGAPQSAIGSYEDFLISNASSDGTIAWLASIDFIGSIDNVTCERVIEIE